MRKRTFIDFILILLCLLPLIVLLFGYFRNGSVSDPLALISDFEISDTFTGYVSTFFTDYLDVSADSIGFQIFSVILSNCIFVYIGFILVEVLIFIPKMAIKLLRMGVHAGE